MAASATLTGKAGKVVLAGATLVFTKWTASVKKQYANSTDSSSYDAVTGQTFSKQDAGEIGMEGTIEGHWDKNSTSANIWQLMKADTVRAATFSFDQTTNFASCNVDLTGFDTGVTVPGAEEVDFTCNWMSNGTITWF